MPTSTAGSIQPSIDSPAKPRHIRPFASGGANERYDIAVFELDVASAITPAPLPAANLLAAKVLKRATFTTVERCASSGSSASPTTTNSSATDAGRNVALTHDCPLCAS